MNPISNYNTDATVLDELGRRLQRSRLERNVTQARLAEEAGISKTTLERIERGDDVRLNSFVRVLRALGQLDGLDHLVPEPLPSPIERVKLEGRRRRRAASHRDKTPPKAAPGWRWGDEEPGR